MGRQSGRSESGHRSLKNEYEICVYNKKDSSGVQCTVSVHVDDLIVTCVNDAVIIDLKVFLKKRYGEMTSADGSVLNYLGMMFDMSTPGQAKMTMQGYEEDTIAYAGVVGHANSPATDGLFETRVNAVELPKGQRSWFHSVVAKLAHLVMLRPGIRVACVRLYVDAAYGVHSDGKSHMGSYVVIGDVGAVHCKSSKQSIVTKSSTEAELIALSDSANQGIFIRNFLLGQGYKVPPVTVYQDNTSCMALIERGRSGAERTRHISIRYFWLRERVENKEAVVVHKGTKEMYANVLTKPLQGSQFVYERGCLTGWK